MDIIVTIPKAKVAYVRSKKAKMTSAWWRIPGKPKNAGRGDKIGFIWDGAVRAVADITQIRKHQTMEKWQQKVEVHFRNFRHCNPIPHEHFRSYQYYDLTGAN